MAMGNFLQSNDAMLLLHYCPRLIGIIDMPLPLPASARPLACCYSRLAFTGMTLVDDSRRQ